jgi:hypothetical protein
MLTLGHQRRILRLQESFEMEIDPKFHLAKVLPEIQGVLDERENEKCIISVSVFICIWREVLLLEELLDIRALDFPGGSFFGRGKGREKEQSD